MTDYVIARNLSEAADYCKEHKLDRRKRSTVVVLTDSELGHHHLLGKKFDPREDRVNFVSTCTFGRYWHKVHGLLVRIGWRRT